jgi:hypothetical protein
MTRVRSNFSYDHHHQPCLSPGERKGKGSTPPSDLDLDVKINRVLDILPDRSCTYIWALLVHPDYPFKGGAEGVVGALLEGTAPQPAEVEVEEGVHVGTERKNVWE